MIASAGDCSQQQSDRLCLVHYLKTLREWSYLFTASLMVMDENDGPHDDAALSARR